VTGTPRVRPLPVDDAKAVAAESGVPDYYADLRIFQVVLRHGRLARSISDLLSPLLFEGRLDPRLRELVIMRLGWTTDSVYEWTQHWRIATGMGITEEDLLGVRDWRGHPFGPAERAVLAATDETVDTGTISDGTWAACAEALDGDETVLLELVGVIGAWRMVSSILRSLDIPLEDGVEPWPPDGRRPEVHR
jgi:alkylhydroperoxidase family enzyme